MIAQYIAVLLIGIVMHYTIQLLTPGLGGLGGRSVITYSSWSNSIGGSSGLLLGTCRINYNYIHAQPLAVCYSSVFM